MNVQRWATRVLPAALGLVGAIGLCPAAQAQSTAPAAPAESTMPAAAMGSAASTVSAAVTVDLRLQRLSDRVWWVEGEQGVISRENQGFNSNAGFVVTDEGVVVFDALGTPALGRALLERIRSVTDKPVRKVVISHYHADHFYGVLPFREQGAEVWAHEAVLAYLASEAPAERLQERSQSLAPWVAADMPLRAPDQVVHGSTSFELGGIRFQLVPAGPAHSPEDLMMLVEGEGVLFAGDLIFAGRVPYVGDADSKGWLSALERFATFNPRFVVTGHGPASRDAAADIALTRDYLVFLRKEMGKAVDEFITFDEAYASTDWSRFAQLPAFEEANRRNAYNTYLLMESESLAGQR